MIAPSRAITLYLYQVDRERSKAARDRLLGKRFSQPLVTDRWTSICLAHLLLDFQAFGEAPGMVGVLGRALKQELKAVFELWRLFQGGELNVKQLRRRCQYRRIQIKDLLRDGWFYTQSG